METPDQKCATEAAQQFGIIGVEQCLASGLSKEALYRRIRVGKFDVIRPGAYRMPGTPASWEGELMAALLSAGPEALVSHRAAATLYGLEGSPGGVLELSLRNGRRLPGVVIHRLRPGDDPAFRYIGPIALTAPERTLLDLAAVLPARQVGLAIDDALRRKMTTLDRLTDQLVLVQARGRNGVARFRKLLDIRDERDARLRSTFEAKMLRICKRVDADVTVDHHVRFGSFDYYLDLAFPWVKLGVECQSLRYHTGERSKRDWLRHRHLSLAGWTILYFSWDDVAFAPAMVEGDIRGMIRQLSAP
ncbi:MAG: type IV toxin-antitoxin system AbiEi family antitoxin domain-containing protein [Actinobacteria bacterium]|nr:type IV toxin-antitoxin system AbiEi family antitoxin domain-containing protein [Actinomycetota bacterium]